MPELNFETIAALSASWVEQSQKSVIGRDQWNQKKVHREDAFNLFGLEASPSLEGRHKFPQSYS